MLAAAIGWLFLANLSINPSLIVGIAKHNAQGQRTEALALLSSGFFLSFTIAAIVGMAALAIALFGPVANLFGPTYVQDEEAIRLGLAVLSIFFVIQVALSSIESAQSALHRQHVNNLVVAASGVPCVVAMLVVAQVNPSPVALIIALNGPSLTFRLANCLAFLYRTPDLVPSVALVRRDLCRNLTSRGAIYALAGTASNLLSHVLPILVVGRSLDAENAAAFAATMNAVILLSGVTTMLTVPLWPALADAVARNDREWGLHAYRRLAGAVLIFGLGVALTLSFAGEWIFGVWFRGHIAPAPELLAAAGVYFLFSSLEVVHFMVLVGLDHVRQASLLVFARALAGTTLLLAVNPLPGSFWPFAAMVAAIVLVDLIPLRRATISALAKTQK